MKTLLILAVVLFVFIRILRSLGRAREMERRIYSETDRKRGRSFSSSERTGMEEFEIPA